MNRTAALFLCLLAAPGVCGAQTWQDALQSMPLKPGLRELTRTNCVAAMLEAFRPGATVKALVFMPGATDEFYMFRRARAQLTNRSPTLLDAVSALTNQTQIEVTFRAPLLLLHTEEDPLEPEIKVSHPGTAAKLRRLRFAPQLNCNDRDWDYVQPILKRNLSLDVHPWRWSRDSWHFYRHSLAAAGLSGWEAVEAIALAGKSKLEVKRNRLDFTPDPRVRAVPRLAAYPK